MNSSYIQSPPEPERGGGVRRSVADVETPETKRRKIRKGTRSCWECKRRKIRCNFGSASDAVCIGCHRRGTHCLSQEYPEEASRPAERGQQIGDRIVRVEALVEQLVRKVGNASPPDSQSSPITTFTSSSKTTPAEREDPIAASHPGLPTPCPSDIESTQFNTFCNASPADHQSAPPCTSLTPLVAPERGSSVTRATGASLTPKLQKLSRELYAALPSAEVALHICQSVGGFSLYFHQMMTRSRSDFDIEMATPEQSAELPSPNAHPVMIAKFLLNLAEYLQYIPHDQAVIDKLGESPRAMMKRLADAAIVVTTDEELMGTVESLQCIILEGAYQANSGNLRRAWLAFRRAMVVGQLMGIHRKRIANVKKLDPSTQADPQFMWYRIQFADRFLGLMLGLPAGSLDNTFASEAVMGNEPPMNKLERRMAVIASRILERNECAPESCNLAETQAIDLELQKAAKTMPSKWWLPPNLSQMAQNTDQTAIFWETLRLTNQIFYYNLLNQLHLPYMLMFSSEKHTVYSKLACVNASREVLSRFIAFRTWNKVAFCCRSVDFFALMAAMTLVLAHLHANDEPDLNCLAHQRHSDRAMMEQVLESMEMVYKLNMDVLSQKSGDLLRRLLEIEADAAEGRRYDTRSVMEDMAHDHHTTDGTGGSSTTIRNCTKPGGPCAQSDESGALHEHHASDDEPGVLRMCIPYFGIIRIAREGGISREPPAAGGLTLPPQPLGLFGVGDRDSIPSSSMVTNTSDNNVDCDAYCPVQLHGVINMSKFSPQQAVPEPQTQSQSHQQNVLHDHAAHHNNDFSSNQGYGSNLIDDNAAALQQQYPFPGLAASADDWAFQGVDMAFFDNLMKGLDQNANTSSVQQPVQADNGALGFGGNSWQ
ncbi:hypothetical protein CONLIGDRAFT_669883 [Coniochaeta ligniaria NRRL 30616]|uniref:Zn(2)-C6 fungal-type domain-containing protein n=1 Tax=Coniochaeta ligniaria NRRL 30616 TaxID=1408157 RepID=A0A1J7JK04_9PEZI|nr:hypothetical protein CONLIGDRAFT_669883 [Coniochaeta ligniaria NRRL 30616]